MIEHLERATGRQVSRETVERLELYADRLKQESRRQNLISGSTVAQLWDRHIVDSAQLVRFEPRTGASWIDIGSGAGLPGVVIACLVSGPVTLVEPRKLRAQFLAEIAELLGLNTVVQCARAEKVKGPFDVITARAVAPLAQFLKISHHLSTKKTVWALPKGRNAQSELAEAQRSWQGVFHVERSVTDPNSHILVGTGVRARQ